MPRLIGAAIQKCQPVERALQNIGSGHFIDDGGPFGARRVLRDQGAGDGGGGKPLVPGDERAGTQRAKIAHKSMRRLHTRTGTAIHVERHADDQCSGVEFVHDGYQFLRIDAEFGARQRLKRRRNPPLNIRQRQADGDRTKVDADQPGVAGQGGREGFEGEEHQGWVAWGGADVTQFPSLTVGPALLQIYVLIKTSAESGCAPSKTCMKQPPLR